VHATFAALLFADFTVWVWGVLLVFWIVSALIGVIRRGVKTVTRAAQAAQPSAAGGDDGQPTARLATGSSDLGARSLGPAETLGKELLTQIEAARQAASTLTVSGARAAAHSWQPAALTSAGQALAATLSNVLDIRGTSSDSTGLPMQSHSVIQGLPVLLHAPGGPALAVLSATVIGPCTALKTAPQEPGGW
jgi:hypothetical protein